MNKTGYQHQRRFDNVYCTLILPVAKGDAFSSSRRVKFLTAQFLRKSNSLYLREFQGFRFGNKKVMPG